LEDETESYLVELLKVKRPEGRLLLELCKSGAEYVKVPH
jgi:hypothetical protein